MRFKSRVADNLRFSAKLIYALARYLYDVAEVIEPLDPSLFNLIREAMQKKATDPKGQN